MKFKTKVLSAAVLAAVGATSAQAVTIDNDGIGQVLLYPYYTVQSNSAGKAYDTLMSVVNTTSRGKAVKVRFLESLNSREVLDFNLYLSPNDVWTGKITATATGGKLVATDTSCTSPPIATANGGPGEVEFFTYGFDGQSGVPADALGTLGLPRTREGYIEVIEMGDIDPEYSIKSASGSNVNFLTAITHTGSGASRKPADCASVTNEWSLATPFPNVGHTTTNATPDVAGLQILASGGLAGEGTLINVLHGTDYGYDPTVLSGFNPFSNHTAPGSLSPSLRDALPLSTVILTDPILGTATVINSVWDNTDTYGGVNAVSAALMRNTVIDEYVVNTAIKAGTDWVVTMPTKRFYVDQVKYPVRPFSKIFTTDGACETIGLKYYDQEELSVTSGVVFSPAPIGKGSVLCWEANIITFNNSNVLASTRGSNVSVGAFPAGWLTLTFPPSTTNASYSPALRNSATTSLAADQISHQLHSTTGGETYWGLPVIGFSVQQYVNDVLPGGVLSNYGGEYSHKYQRLVTNLTQ